MATLSYPQEKKTQKKQTSTNVPIISRDEVYQIQINVTFGRSVVFFRCLASGLHINFLFTILSIQTSNPNF